MPDTCRYCGRPLRDKVSVETGVGRMCANNARAVRPEPVLFSSNYFFEIAGDVLVLFDKDSGSNSLANDMDRVLRDLSARIGPLLPANVIYRDSAGRYDGVRHRKGVFGGFYPIGATTLLEALGKLQEAA
jgi:Family of unknown function (DUF6011)